MFVAEVIRFVPPLIVTEGLQALEKAMLACPDCIMST